MSEVVGKNRNTVLIKGQEFTRQTLEEAIRVMDGLPVPIFTATVADEENPNRYLDLTLENGPYAFATTSKELNTEFEQFLRLLLKREEVFELIDILQTAAVKKGWTRE